jgi:uncharacterized membrane protein YeaQ/YmgE (transglycosylase-associated protein family)
VGIEALADGVETDCSHANLCEIGTEGSTGRGNGGARAILIGGGNDSPQAVASRLDPSPALLAMQVLHQLAVYLFVGCLFGVIGAALDWRSGGQRAPTALALGLVGALVFALIGVAWTIVTGMTLAQEFLGRKSSFGLALVLVTASSVIHAGGALRKALARRRRVKTRAPGDS